MSFALGNSLAIRLPLSLPGHDQLYSCRPPSEIPAKPRPSIRAIRRNPAAPASGASRQATGRPGYMLTAEPHEPAAAAGYVSHRGRSKGIVIGLLLLALAAAGAYGWYRHELAHRRRASISPARQHRRAAGESGLQGRGPDRLARSRRGGRGQGRPGDSHARQASISTTICGWPKRAATTRRPRSRGWSTARVPRRSPRPRPESPSSGATAHPLGNRISSAERLVGQGAVSRETFDQTQIGPATRREARLKAAEETEQMAVIGPRARKTSTPAGRNWRPKRRPSIQSERRLTDSELIAPSDGDHSHPRPRKRGRSSRPAKPCSP